MWEAGYVGMNWPGEFGGRGAPLTEQIILYQEMARAESPQFVNRGGLSMLGPTLMKHGTPAQQKRHLQHILTADELWCQGFSEPNAGSDLANLATRAVLEDDAFVVNGQKVWTSMAHVADWCFLLVRTDPDAPKHKGISFLLVDMNTQGITVRPLRQLTGEAEFNEVFFDNVRVPRDNLVGRHLLEKKNNDHHHRRHDEPIGSVPRQRREGIAPQPVGGARRHATGGNALQSQAQGDEPVP